MRVRMKVQTCTICQGTIDLGKGKGVTARELSIIPQSIILYMLYVYVSTLPLFAIFVEHRFLLGGIAADDSKYIRKRD